MAKLSHGAYSWRAEGLAKKYKSEADSHNEPKNKSQKKNTQRWCRGKTGKEHMFRRRFVKLYSYQRNEYVPGSIETYCLICDKSFYKQKKDSKMPLEIWVKEYASWSPIQVKFNGKCIPFSKDTAVALSRPGSYYCEACQEWHY